MKKIHVITILSLIIFVVIWYLTAKSIFESSRAWPCNEPTKVMGFTFTKYCDTDGAFMDSFSPGGTKLTTKNVVVDATVEKIVSVDMLIVRMPDGKIENVRLIGIESPDSMNEYSIHNRKKLDIEEISVMKKEAIDFVKALFSLQQDFNEDNQINVKLSFDDQYRDNNGNIFAYVSVPKIFINGEIDPHYVGKPERLVMPQTLSEGTFLNATVIQYGYATPETTPPNEMYADLFQHLVQEASANERGFWEPVVIKECSEENHFQVEISRNGKQETSRHCRSSSIKINEKFWTK